MNESSRRGRLFAIGAALVAMASIARAESQGQPTIEPIGCRNYGLNAFLSDPDVKSRWVADDGSRIGALLPPCTERVDRQATKPNAASELMKELFSTRDSLEKLQNGFDLYSWLTFVALNSPADPHGEFGSAGEKTVWEQDFAPLEDVIDFHDGELNDSRWNPPVECKAKAEGVPKPTLFVRMDDIAYDQPFKTGPIVDQNGMYTLNTIFMNREMVDFIVDSKLSSFAGQRRFKKVVDFPVGTFADDKKKESETKDALGSMMIKASWRVIPEGEDHTDIHTVRAYQYFPKKKECELITVGLVGFHVVHKTTARRQWIWTTFEHVRNAPSASEVRLGDLPMSSYYFFDADAKTDCAKEDASGECPSLDHNIPPLPPWDEAPPRQRSQIVRTFELSKDTTTINAQAHEHLINLAGKPDGEKKSGFARDSVWRHYQLISTQWPADFRCAQEQAQVKAGGTPITIKNNEQADPACAPAPEFLGNSTLESYIQHDIGVSGVVPGAPQSTTSCIGCHNNAVGYQQVNYGDQQNLEHSEFGEAERSCTLFINDPGATNSDREGNACSPASDFTFILEQVCAPMTDLKTGLIDPRKCKRDH